MSFRGRVEIDWFDGCRDELNELFALADDSTVAVARYRDMGRILTAREGGKIIGHLQLVDAECAGEIEVKSLAVSEDRQGQGIGSRLLERGAHAAAPFSTSRRKISSRRFTLVRIESTSMPRSARCANSSFRFSSLDTSASRVVSSTSLTE